MIMQDSYLPLECTPETLAEGTTVPLAECTFCTNTAIPDFDVIYSETGLHHHCLDCAIEFGLPEAGYQQPVDN
jgi:hypothetical protein